MIRHLRQGFGETNVTASCSEKEKRSSMNSTYLLGLYVIFLVMAFVQSPHLYFDGFRKQVQCSTMKGYAGHSTLTIWSMYGQCPNHTQVSYKSNITTMKEQGGNGTITIPQVHRITDTESANLLPS